MVKNSLFSVMEFGWPIIIALVASPYIVRSIGPDACGVLSIVGVALGVFGFLDLGMGGAARFTRALDLGPAESMIAREYTSMFLQLAIDQHTH